MKVMNNKAHYCKPERDKRCCVSGAGLSTVIMSFLLTTYYNVIMSWALFYLVYSFSPSLPWEVNNLLGNKLRFDILLEIP